MKNLPILFSLTQQIDDCNKELSPDRSDQVSLLQVRFAIHGTAIRLFQSVAKQLLHCQFSIVHFPLKKRSKTAFFL